jgi:hypothetical protein
MNTTHLTNSQFADTIMYGTVNGPTLALGKADHTTQSFSLTIHELQFAYTDTPFDPTQPNVEASLTLYWNQEPVSYTVLDTLEYNGLWYALLGIDNVAQDVLIPLLP